MAAPASIPTIAIHVGVGGVYRVSQSRQIRSYTKWAECDSTRLNSDELQFGHFLYLFMAVGLLLGYPI